jgi:hypothetical protein
MALCAVIAIAIVAPKIFMGKRDSADWSEEIKELHSRYKSSQDGDNSQLSADAEQPGKDKNEA